MLRITRSSTIVTMASWIRNVGLANSFQYAWDTSNAIQIGTATTQVSTWIDYNFYYQFASMIGISTAKTYTPVYSQSIPFTATSSTVTLADLTQYLSYKYVISYTLSTSTSLINNLVINTFIVSNNAA